MLVGVLGPLAVYAGYAYLTPLGGRSYGTFASVERIGVEYAAVACAVIVLLRVLSEAALRRRGVELGTDELVRERPGKVAIVVGILLGAAVVGYLAAWHVAAARFEWSHGSPTGGWGVLLAIAVASYGLTWMGSAAGGEGRGGWWRYMPAWVGWAATAAALGTVGWRLWGKPLEHNQAMLLNMVSHAIVLAAGAATLALVGIMVILGRRLHDGSGSRQGVFELSAVGGAGNPAGVVGAGAGGSNAAAAGGETGGGGDERTGGSYRASQGIDLSAISGRCRSGWSG